MTWKPKNQAFGREPLDLTALEEYRRDPRRAITEAGVICLVCGHSFRHLTNTHLRRHGLTSSEYKRQFGYNIRRALMISLSRRTHTENARKLGLAARIRHRRILDDLELKRQGGRHAHSLEELLTRRDRAPQIFTDRVKARDEQGRFVGASVVASLQSPGLEEQPWTHYTLMVNGQCMQAGEVAADMPLLWVLRDGLNLKGVKYGCGVGACGACTVLLDGQARRACQIPISAVGKRSITTVEGLSADGSHPLQRAWMELDVPQCGYCQAGQLMAAAALLGKTADPTDDEINAAMNGNICRCGTYLRIRSAIHLAARLTKGSRDGGNP